MFNGIKICNKTQKYEINVNIGSKTVWIIYNKT